jgi:pimeloyl-ACP methyl ester carboxylesterase
MLTHLASAAVMVALVSSPALAQSDAAFESTIVRFAATDGTPLEGRLTLPSGATDPLPVVFYIHGAGPRGYDSTYPYRDAEGQIRVGRFLDYHAQQLAARGIALFSISKRGCTPTDEPPGIEVDREVFSGATLTVLTDDYARALAVLRTRDEIDPRRIVLIGSSEGTRIAPMLAHRSPEGIVGVAMMAYAADNARDTVAWQNSVGPWRNIQQRIPAARDGKLTREEYEAFVQDRPKVRAVLPFDPLDVDRDDALTDADLRAVNAPGLAAINTAVEEGHDDFLWQRLGQLSSTYLRDWWDAEPNVNNLLRLDIPLAIFHGDLDGTCRVEGVHEARDAFADAGKSNLEVHLYPDGNHDLNWTSRAFDDGGPRPYLDAFDFVSRLVARP